MHASLGNALSPHDESAILTNDDASSCKIWASKVGYFTDAYCRRLVPRGQDNPPRRMPEISRGYWARVDIISKVVRSFIQLHSCNCQVVILGCGYDSLYWRSRDHPTRPLIPSLWVEIDLPPVVYKKTKAIQLNFRSSPELFPAEQPLIAASDMTMMSPSSSKMVFRSGNYRIASGDLNQSDKLLQLLLAPETEGGIGIDSKLPTLFVAECVLVYLQPEKCAALLSTIASHIADSSMLVYEQCNISPTGDERSFGRVMLDQLSAQGLQLLGVDACVSLDSQIARLQNAGFDESEAASINVIYSKYLNNTGERTRIEKLEMLDETHLLEQLLSHYCIAFGQKKGNVSSKFDLNKALTDS